FFFSSRRRHTRCYRDWSSDVCSSDLLPRCLRRLGRNLRPSAASASALRRYASFPVRRMFRGAELPSYTERMCKKNKINRAQKIRSEERRVGKERRDKKVREYRKKKEN